ncbi:MAG: hypothetical protein OEY10_00080 [Nitrosopumilus sp.]|nr:hypothetical protein [Nitrosopumilus sp.]
MMNKKYKEWLAGLKVGDKVLLSENEDDETIWYSAKVTRITKTLIIVNDEDEGARKWRVKRKTGLELGGCFYPAFIEPWTPELLLMKLKKGGEDE